jgi:uncharacterized membrane protein
VIARLWEWIRSRREQEQGAVLILTSIALIAILGAGAMGVDVGFTVVGSRTAQAMADTAAADLIQYINAADQEPNMTGSNSVTSFLTAKLAGVDTDNASDAQLAVQPLLYQNGTYSYPTAGCQDTVPFNPAVPVCNAVAVQAKQAVPQPFWGGFNTLVGKSGGCSFPLSKGGSCTSCPTTSCYTWTPMSCFSIGSYLVSISAQQQGVLNDILGQSLDSSADITAVGYQGLANTYVSLGQLITASGSVLTPTNVMTQSLTAGQWLSIFTDAVDNQTSSGMCSTGDTTAQTNASTALASLSFPTSSSTSVELCQLVEVNGKTCSALASGSASVAYNELSAGVNVLQTLTTEAELANGSNGVDITTALGVTGVTTAKLYLNVLQPPQIAFGPVGSYTAASPCPPTTGTSTCAETQQVTADLQLTLPALGVLDIPLSAADGVATLSTLTCSNDAMTNTKINASTTTATAAITLTPSGGSPSAVATLTINGASSTSESYSSSVVPPTDSTMSAGTNPRSLGTPLVSYSGGPSAQSPVFTLLTSTLPGFYAPVLLSAGVSVGNADVADLGTDCDAIEIGP